MLGDIERVLAALNEAGVRYLVVGGVAVVLHGHLRTTVDLDLVVHLVPENVLRAVRALGTLGYKPRAPVAIEDFVDAEVRARWIREKGLKVFSLWSGQIPRLQVDLFVEEPFDFEGASSRALRVPLGTTEAPLLSRDDLIAMKRAAGRHGDLADVEALEAIAKRGEPR